MTGKTFLTMLTNTGKMCRDTGVAFQTLCKVWINDAYQDAWRRGLWTDIIDDDYTFTSVADQTEYDLPSDFGKEVFVGDLTNGHEVKRWDIGSWWKERVYDYNAGSLQSGNPVRYVILPESGKIKLDPPPKDGSETYAMPYQKEVSDMTSDTETPSITTISTFLEYHGTSMGMAYKKRYAQADWWANKAEFELQKLIKNEYKKINQLKQRKLYGKRVAPIRRLTGDTSYDTI